MPRRLEKVGVVRHAVTHRRLEIEAWRAEAPSTLPRAFRAARSKRHLWLDPRALGDVPVGAASRKVMEALAKAWLAQEQGRCPV